MFFFFNHHANSHQEVICRYTLNRATSRIILTLNSHDESEVEKEARSSPQAQEKKDESEIVGFATMMGVGCIGADSSLANKRPTLLDLNQSPTSSWSPSGLSTATTPTVASNAYHCLTPSVPKRPKKPRQDESFQHPAFRLRQGTLAAGWDACHGAVRWYHELW